MSWQHSPRTASARRTSTRAWRKTRAEALDRDGYHCTIRGPHCTGHATEVDHITPVWLHGTDELHNLASTCTACHTTKTARDAALAKRKPNTHQPHPGLKR